MVYFHINARCHWHIVRLQNVVRIARRDDSASNKIVIVVLKAVYAGRRMYIKSTTGEIIERGLFRLGTTLPINNSRKRLPHISRPDKQYISVGDSSIRGRSCWCVVIIIIVTRQAFYARLPALISKKKQRVKRNYWIRVQYRYRYRHRTFIEKCEHICRTMTQKHYNLFS